MWQLAKLSQQPVQCICNTVTELASKHKVVGSANCLSRCWHTVSQVVAWSTDDKA